MTVLQLRRQPSAASGRPGGRLRRIPALAAALTMTAGLGVTVTSVSAQAADVNLTPGPTVYADPSSPTGYTGHFVYCNPAATSVRFAADIMLRNWADQSDTKVYSPFEYKPGLMRGGGGYDVQMTSAGNGCWYTDVPLAAGANQYWFYVNNNTNLWVADPANSPIFAPDGLTGTARRAFNKVFVPYDAAKQAYGPLAERVIENARTGIPHGTWSYVPFQVNGTTRTMGVYLPPGYDADRATPYKTIYMQHGGGQDQSDWMNMGDVPVIMDNLIADGDTEPAVVVTPYLDYMGNGAQGYPNLRNVVIPFVEGSYNVSTKAIDRAFAGLSLGSIATQNIINYDATEFGYYGPWSGGASVRATTANVDKPYMLFGGGKWDFGLPNATTVANLDRTTFTENLVVAGAHDFNTWDQMFTKFARDYLWKPDAFMADKFAGLKSTVAGTNLNGGNKNALTVKLTQAEKQVVKGANDEAVEILDGYIAQVQGWNASGKLTDDQAAGLLADAQRIRSNLAFWLS